MHRIDSDGSVNNRFSEGNPSLGVEGTKVTADWLNDVQEAIAYVIESSGLELEKGNPALLANAILSAIESGSFSNIDTRITQLNSSYLYGARNVFRQDDEPLEHIQGPFFDNDIWIETDQDPEKLWIWNSISKSWVDTANDRVGRGIFSLQKKQAIADGVVNIYIQNETPTDGVGEGDIWYNERDDLLFVYDTDTWIQVYDEVSKRVIIESVINYAAKTAQGLADSKIKTYYQATEPVGLTPSNDGDLWFDIDDGNKLYRYTHPVWEEVQDDGISKAIDYIILQGAIADGTIFIYFSPVPPDEENQAILVPPNPGPSEGDIWIDISKNEEGVVKNDPYVYHNDEWELQTDPEFRALLISFASARAIQDGAVTIYFSDEEPDDTFIPAPRYGDIWFDTSDESVPNPDEEDPANSPFIIVPRYAQYRYDGTNWIPIADFRLKIIEANLRSEAFARSAADSAQAGLIETATTKIGENEATIQRSMVSINGIATAYGVITNVNNKVVGFGFLTDYEREIEFTHTGSKNFNPADRVYVGEDFGTATYTAVIVTVDNINGTMRVISESGSFLVGETLTAELRTDANATIDGSTENPTPGVSEFEILIDRFKITDGTTSLTPFSIVNGIVYVGAIDTSTPQTNFIGAFANEPDTTYPINSIYKNTTNGNTYILEYISGNSGPKHWVIFIERGTNARSLIITADSPGFLFDSSSTSVPTNASLTIRTQYNGMNSAINSNNITITDKNDQVLLVPLTNVVSNFNQEQDAGSPTNSGYYQFDITYSDFAATDFPILVTVTDGVLSDEVLIPRIVGSTAKTMSVNPDTLVFIFEDDVATTPQNSGITFRIQHVGLGSAPTVSELTIVDSDNPATTYAPTNYVAAVSGTGTSTFDLPWATVASAVFPVRVTVTDENITDVVTIRKLVGGVDATVGFLTNESHTIPANELGELEPGALDGAVGTFDVYQGISKKNTEVSYSVLNTFNASAIIDDSTGATAGDYAVTSFTENIGWVDFRAQFDTAIIVKRMSLAKSIAGQNARILRLISDEQTFRFNGDNTATDPSAIITFTTYRTNLGPATWTAINENSDPVALSGSSDDTRTLSIGNFGLSQYVTVTATVEKNGVTYSDTITVVRLREGSSAIQIVFSNENHTFYADEEGTIAPGDYDIGNSLVRVFRGTEEIIYQSAAGANKFRLGTITASQGITVDTGEIAPTVGISLMTGLFGYIDIPVIYRNKDNADTTITRRISYSKAVEGQKGRTLQLFATKQVFGFDSDGTPINPTDTITVEARKQNLGTVSFVALDQDGATVAITGTGDSRDISISAFDDSETVTITATAEYSIGVDDYTVTDKLTIYRLTGASPVLNTLLTNENHTFFAQDNGTIPTADLDEGNCDIRVFRGSEEIVYNGAGALNTFRFGTIVVSGVTLDVSEIAPTVGVSDVFENSGSLVVPIIYTDPNGNEEIINRTISYSKAKTGAQARNISLSASSQIFRFNAEGEPLASSDDIILTTERQLIGVAPTFTAVDQNGDPIALINTGDDERRLTIVNFGAAEYVEITASATVSINGSDVTYRDTITIVALKQGSDALTPIVANEAHTLNADENGVVSDYTTANTSISLYRGGTLVQYGNDVKNWRFGTISASNVTVAELVPPNVGISAMSALTGRLHIPIIYKDANGVDFTLYKEISYTKSLAGVAARNLRLFATKLVFEFDSTNEPINVSDSIRFTASTTNVSNLLFTAIDQNSDPVTLTNTGNIRDLSITDFGDASEVTVTVSGTSEVSGNTVNFIDAITVVRLREGAGGIQVALTNESHAFYADEANNVLSGEFPTGNSTIHVYNGTESVAYDASGSPNTWRLGTVLESNVTRDTSLVLPIIGINAFDAIATSGFLRINIIYTDNNSIERSVIRELTYTKATAGQASRTLRLLTSSQIFAFTVLGQPVDNTDSITLTVDRQFINGTTSFIALDEAGASISLRPGSNADERILEIGDFGTSQYVTITASATDSFTGETYSDRVRIIRLNQGAEGKNGITVFVSNENHTFAASELGVVDDYSTGNFTISLYLGSTPVGYSATKQNNTYRIGNVVTNNVTQNTSLVAPVLGISDMLDDVGSLTVPVVYTDESGVDATFNKVVTYAKSRAGTSSSNIRLFSDGQFFQFNQMGQPVDSNQVITFTSFGVNVGTITWEITSDDNPTIAFTLLPDSNTRTLDIDDIGEAKIITVTASASDGSNTYTDKITVYRIDQASDALTITASNESHTFFADESGVILGSDYSGGDCTFTVRRGITPVSYNGSLPYSNNTWRIGSITAPASLSITNTDNVTRVTSMTVDNVQATIEIIYTDEDGVEQSYDKVLSYSKSRNGRDARWVKITASEQVFRYNQDDLPINSGQTIALTIDYNLLDIGDIVVTAEDEAQNPIVLGGSGANRTINISSFGNSEYAIVEAVASVTIEGQPQVVRDQITIARIRAASDAIQALIANESHTFAADEDGIVDSFAGGNTSITVYRGLEEISYDGTSPYDNKSFHFGTIITSTGITLAELVEPNIGISAMTQDFGTVTVPVIYKDQNGDEITINKVISYSKARSGEKARLIRLYSTGTIFTFDQDGNPKSGGPATHTITAISTNLGVPTFSAVDENGTPITPLTNGVNDFEKLLSVETFKDYQSIRITASATHDSTTYSDEITFNRVQEGTSKIVVSLSNEAHIFGATEEGTVIDYDSGDSNVRVFRGAEEIAYSAAGGNNTFLINNFLTTNVTRDTVLALPNVGISSMADDGGTLSFDVVFTDPNGIQEPAITKTISYSRARAGVNARNLRLFTSASQFNYDGNDDPIVPNAEITLTVIKQFIPETVLFVAINNSEIPVTLSGSGNTRTLTITDFGTSQYVDITASVTNTVNGNSTTYTDTIRINRIKDGFEGVSGENAIEVFLTNPQTTFALDQFGVPVNGYAAGDSSIEVYLGTTSVAFSATPSAGKWHFGTITETNVDATTNNSSIGIVEMYADYGSVSFQIIYTTDEGSPVTFNRTLNYTKARAGLSQRRWRLNVDNQVFKYDGDDFPKDPSAVITFDLDRSSSLPSPEFTLLDQDGIPLLISAGASVDQKKLTVINFDGATIATMKAAMSEYIPSYANSYMYDFTQNSYHQWVQTGAASSNITTNGWVMIWNSVNTTNGYVSREYPADKRFDGAMYRYAAVELEVTGNTSGTAQARIYWKTSGHGFADTHYTTPFNKPVTDMLSIGTHVFVYDMWNPDVGGTDFKDNVISGLRFDPYGNGSGDITIKKIGMAEDYIYFEDSVQINKIVDGLQTITVINENQSHTYPADENGNIVGGFAAGSSTISVYRGGTPVSYNATPTAGSWRFGTLSATTGLTVSNTNNIVTPTSFTVDSGVVTVPVIYKTPNGDDETYTTKISYTKAREGILARTLSITAGALVFAFDQDGGLEGSNDKIDFVATGLNMSAPYTWSAIDENGGTVSLVTVNDTTRRLTLAAFGDANRVTVTVQKTVNIDGSNQTFSDAVTVGRIQKASSNITIVPTNESHTFFADENGVVSNYGGGGSIFKVYRGLDEIIYDGLSPYGNNTWRFGTITKTNISVSTGNGLITVSNMTADNATADIEIIYTNSKGIETSAVKTLSYAKAFRGFTGINGLAIFQTNPNHTFATDTSGTLLPGVSFEDGDSTFSVFLGDEELPYSATPQANTFEITSVIGTGVTVDTSEIKPTVGISGMSADSGFLSVTIVPHILDTVDSPSIVQRVNYTRSSSGENAIQYFIRPTNGTVIKNGSGTLSGKLMRIDGSGVSEVTSGSIKIYVAGQTTGSYTYALTAGAINGTVVLEARNGTHTGTLLDTITLYDVADGLGGGFVQASNGLTLVRTNPGTGIIADLLPASTTLTSEFYATGTISSPYTKPALISGRVNNDVLQLRFTNQAGASQISVAAKRGDGFAAVSGTWHNTNSMSVTFTFTDPVTNRITRVTETVYAVSNGIRGSRTFYATGSSWSDATAVAAIQAAGFEPIVADIVTISNPSIGFSETRAYDGTSWITVAQVINGNLIVQGTMAADRIASGLIQSANIEIGSSRFTLSGASETLTVRDEAATARVKLGKLGIGSTNYGIEIRNSSNQLILGAGGLTTAVNPFDGNVNWGWIGSIPAGVTGAATSMNSSGQLDWSKIIDGFGSKPEDGATVGARAGVNLTDHLGNAVGALGEFASKVGKLTAADIGVYIDTAAIDTALIKNAAITTALIQNAAISTALIQNLAVTDAKINDLNVGKLTAGTLDVTVNVGSANIKIDGVNNRILISD